MKMKNIEKAEDEKKNVSFTSHFRHSSPPTPPTHPLSLVFFSHSMPPVSSVPHNIYPLRVEFFYILTFPQPPLYHPLSLNNNLISVYSNALRVLDVKASQFHIWVLNSRKGKRERKPVIHILYNVIPLFYSTFLSLDSVAHSDSFAYYCILTLLS